MNVSDLDRWVTLQSATTTTNDLGEEIPTWETVLRVPAAYRPVSDGEKWRAGMVEGRQIARFTIRYLSGIDGTHRLAFEEGTWSITGAKEIGRRKWLEITAEKAA